MELKPRKSDYLKYWRVIRYFVKAKYNLTQADLDMILFLYSETYFDKDKFDEFDELLSWDLQRFNRLRQNGWISVFRKRSGKYKTLYELSYKGVRLVSSIYKKLNGEEIPASKSQNPIFLKNIPYSDRVYQTMIKDMNTFIRQQRHRALE